MPCIICIPRITELNEAKVPLQIHIAQSPIFAEKVLKILCPGMWRNLAHVQLGVTSMSTMAIISIIVIISVIVSRHYAL